MPSYKCKSTSRVWPGFIRSGSKQCCGSKLGARLDTSQLYADVHFHASNYAMQGISLKEYAERYMSADCQQIVRSTIMPIPLQQRWDGFEEYQAQGPNNQIW